MKIFYFLGNNPKTKGGTSSKIWKIERRGCEVHIWSGSVDLITRKYVIRGTLRPSVKRHPSEAAALKDEARRIKDQITQGYERKPRRN